MLLPNRYFICLSYEEEPIPWDLRDDEQLNAPPYYREVLREVERRLPDRGLTFYLTWKLDELPSTGRDVVAVVMGDEWGRVPHFAQDVLACFKCYGAKPFLGFDPQSGLSVVSMLLLAKYIRASASGVPTRARRIRAYARSVLKGGGVTPIIPVPLGYGNQIDAETKPLSERTTDIFFAGSISHRADSGFRRWLQTPKNLARSQMLESVRQLQTDHEELVVQLATTSGFTLNDLHYGTGNPNEILDKQAYSEAMMNAKVCLVPRGTSPETYRYFEALRYGTIPIVERQPPFPFYEGAPVVEIDDWRELPGVARALLTDPDRMERLHQAGLVWWREWCSESAVGSMMATVIEGLTGQ